MKEAWPVLLLVELRRELELLRSMRISARSPHRLNRLKGKFLHIITSKRWISAL